jgi:hypothetical protein
MRKNVKCCSVYSDQATIRQPEAQGVKGSLLRSCVHKLQRHAIQSLHDILESTARKDEKNADTVTNQGPGGGA